MNQSLNNTAPGSLSASQGHEQALGRSNCYGLLALIFRDRPTPETVTQLRTPPLADVLSALGCNVTDHLSGNLQEVATRLHEQYSQTFIGPGPHAPLYASIFCEGGGRLWGDSTVWVKQFIEATGLSFSDNWGSIPDHLTIELELMQRLAACEAQLWVGDSSEAGTSTTEKLSRCLRMQQQFLTEHLCLWIGRFCELVMESSTSSFYREMTGLTKSVVLSDVQQVTAVQRVLRCN